MKNLESIRGFVSISSSFHNESLNTKMNDEWQTKHGKFCRTVNYAFKFEQLRFHECVPELCKRIDRTREIEQKTSIKTLDLVEQKSENDKAFEEWEVREVWDEILGLKTESCH